MNTLVQVHHKTTMDNKRICTPVQDNQQSLYFSIPKDIRIYILSYINHQKTKLNCLLACKSFRDDIYSDKSFNRQVAVLKDRHINEILSYPLRKHIQHIVMYMGISGPTDAVISKLNEAIDSGQFADNVVITLEIILNFDNQDNYATSVLTGPMNTVCPRNIRHVVYHFEHDRVVMTINMSDLIQKKYWKLEPRDQERAGLDTIVAEAIDKETEKKQRRKLEILKYINDAPATVIVHFHIIDDRVIKNALDRIAFGTRGHVKIFKASLDFILKSDPYSFSGLRMLVLVEILFICCLT